MRPRKRVNDSAVVTSRLMMPTDANVVGNVFGGVIVKVVDEVAAIVAFRHARANVVTASIDRFDFHAPVYVGNLLILKAAVNFVGRTSFEVGVRVEAEDLLTGRVTHTGSAYLTYVALDRRGRPKEVPALLPRSREEKRRYGEAAARRRRRLTEKS